MINAIERGINVRHRRRPQQLRAWVRVRDFLMVRKELVDQGKVKDFADLKGLKLAILEPRPNLTDYFATRYLKLGGLTLMTCNP